MPPAIEVRRYRSDDVAAVNDAVIESREALSQWMPWCTDQYGRPDTVAWVEAQLGDWGPSSDRNFVIAGTSGDVLGAIGLKGIDHVNGTAEAGYWVRTSATGRGVGSAALVWLCEWAAKELALHRIEIIASVKNRASQRVAEKAGAVREAVLAKRLVLHNEYHDAVLYARLREL
ncbi:MAG: GNAT family N-acetyltransferase [Planctomycetota bacterium]